MIRYRKIRRLDQPFVHLHNHTEYSFLDALPKVKGLGNIIKSKGFKSYAITDHGNICGVYDFVKDLTNAGIKPIVGCEFYCVANRRRKGLTADERAQAKANGETTKQMESRLELRKNYHVVVLAKSHQGWLKIVRGLEVAHSEGFYYVPRIDFELLSDMAPDVIVMTACLGGVPSRLILADKWGDTVEWASQMVGVFGSDFYIEIQPNEIPAQIKVNPWLVELSETVGSGIVATCDVHYIEPGDWETHDVMLAVRDSVHGRRVLVSDTDRFRYTTHELWLKPYENIVQSFEYFHPDLDTGVVRCAIESTLEIDAKVDPIVLRERKAVLPVVDIESQFNDDPDKKMWHLIREGWKWREMNTRLAGKVGVIDWIDDKEFVQIPLKDVYAERVRYEMDMIVKQGFSKYFLVLYDVIQWCRQNNIRVGPGRGSVGGSIVAYLLGITSVDSIKYHCPFSRFISSDRIDYPDIDTDFPTSERARVKQYLIDKYGSDRVASICTFGRLKGKAVLRDVARVFGVPYSETDAVTQYIIERPDGDERSNDCLIDSIQDSPELQQYASKHRYVVNHASKLEGNVRQLGVNAAGVVISDESLRHMLPVQYQHRYDSSGGKLGDYVTGWEKRAVEAIGLLKLDVLGIECLTYIQRAIDLIRERHSVVIEPEEWEELDDKVVFQNFCAGYTELVWQMNTFTTIRVLKRLLPDKFDHLVATTALIRPGPMNAGITDTYIKRRHGKIVKSIHPLLDTVLESTYGLLVFQEDVIKVCHDVGGFSWAEADKIRKDVGKKKGVEYLQKTYVDKFCAGAEVHGVNGDTAVKIWNMISEFGMYGFNRAHATAYSILSYWTMWFKVHYPLEFMTAALEAESNTDRQRLYIREAKRLGLRVIQPDVNVSKFSYTIDPNMDNVIRSGFVDVKGIGDKTVGLIVGNAPYSSFVDFLQRCKVNKTVIRNLLAVGAFDSLLDEPHIIMGNLDTVLKIRNTKDPVTKWNGLQLNHIEPPTEDERDRSRLELLGLPPEIHPAEKATRRLMSCTNHYQIHTLSEVSDLFPYDYSNHLYAFCGVIEKVKYYTVDVTDYTTGENARKRIAKVDLADDTGVVSVRISWYHVDSFGRDALAVGQVLFIVARSEGYLKLSPSVVANINHLSGFVDRNDSPNLWWAVNDPFGDGLREYLSDLDDIHLIGDPKRNRRRQTAIYVMDAKIKKTSKGYIQIVTGMDYDNVVRSFIVWATDVPIFVNKFVVGNWLVLSVKARVSDKQDTRFSIDGSSPVLDLNRYMERLGGADA